MRFNQAHDIPYSTSIYCLSVDQYVKCWDTVIVVRRRRCRASLLEYPKRFRSITDKSAP